MNTVPTRTTIAKTEARAPNGMVATKDVHATRAGLQMLEMGGNAVDAAVAACFAIGVVEPASSGIGGGGYLAYQVGDRGGVVGFPMKGPLAARPDMYELTGETSVGNFGWGRRRGRREPGRPAVDCRARRGRRTLRGAQAPGQAAARRTWSPLRCRWRGDGHSPGWHNMYSLGLSAARLFEFAELRSVFMPDSKLPTGDLTSPALLRQPELADVLEAVGRDGPAAFYSGDIARAIASDIQANGGIVSEQDLAEYRPFVWDSGLEFAYAGHTVRGSAVRVRRDDIGNDPADAGRLRREVDGPQHRRRAPRLHLGRPARLRGPVRVHGGPGLRRRPMERAGVRRLHGPAARPHRRAPPGRNRAGRPLGLRRR